MAVAFTGTAVTNTSHADGSQAVTIPADAEAVIVISWMYRNNHAGSFDQLNWDDGAALDFTEIAKNSTTADPYDVFAFIMTSADANWPGTGAQTLYWSFTGAPTEGGTVWIYFAKGLNTSSPVGDTETGKIALTGNQQVSTTLANVGADDMCVLAVAEYQEHELSSANTQLGFTDGDNGVEWIIVGDLNDSSLVVDITNSGGSVYTGYVAFVLEVAAAGGTAIPPLAMAHFRRLRNQG